MDLWRHPVEVVVFLSLQPAFNHIPPLVPPLSRPSPTPEPPVQGFFLCYPTLDSPALEFPIRQWSVGSGQISFLQSVSFRVRSVRWVGLCFKTFVAIVGIEIIICGVVIARARRCEYWKDLSLQIKMSLSQCWDQKIFRITT
jgi:hypothetical protein